MADLQTALNEVALESSPLPPVTSAPKPSPLDKIEHAAEEVLSEPSDSLGTEGMASAVISAASSPSEAAEQAAEYPTIIDALAPTSTPNTRHSSPRAGSRWVKRATLLLALSAVIASIQWGLPVLYANLPHATAPTPELVIQLDALQPSSRGDQVPKEIAPIEVTIAPPAQAPSLPSANDDVEALIDRGDQFVRQGDIITARSFYERAAGSGSARAATGVARTFDPTFLSRLGVVGARGNPERAEIWYRKASEAAAREARSTLSDGASLHPEER